MASGWTLIMHAACQKNQIDLWVWCCWFNTSTWLGMWQFTTSLDIKVTNWFWSGLNFWWDKSPIYSHTKAHPLPHTKLTTYLQPPSTFKRRQLLRASLTRVTLANCGIWCPSLWAISVQYLHNISAISSQYLCNIFTISVRYLHNICAISS